MTARPIHLPPIAVFGAGGLASEVGWVVRAISTAANLSDGPMCFVDDDAGREGEIFCGAPVMTLDTALSHHPGAHFVVAVGEPAARKSVVERLEQRGVTFSALIYPNAQHPASLRVGAGTLIMANTVLTENVVVGRHCLIDVGCTISHDARIGDFVTMGPGAHLCGHVHVHALARIGAGATVSNGRRGKPLVIGEGAIVGAGACVLASVEPHTTVVGVPAKPINRRESQ